MKQPVVKRGFTLVELVVTIAILSVALVAIIYGWSISAQHSADATWQARTAYLGQAYLEEILSKRFDENSSSDGSLPCGSGTFEGQAMPACTLSASFGLSSSSPAVSKDGESRANFDDVDDYHGLDETAMTMLEALYGAGANPYSNYRITVSVSYDTTLEATASMVKRISVSVYAPGQSDPAVFAAYKGNI